MRSGSGTISGFKASSVVKCWLPSEGAAGGAVVFFSGNVYGAGGLTPARGARRVSALGQGEGQLVMYGIWVHGCDTFDAG